MKAEHHRVFLHKCRVAKVTPKGLRLNRKVNPIKGVGTNETVAKIERIIKRAEEDILVTLINHNENLAETINHQLEDVEKDIQARPNSEREDIESTLKKAEQSEDELRSSLERTRNDKLAELKRTGPISERSRRKSGPRSLKKGQYNSRWDHKARESRQP